LAPHKLRLTRLLDTEDTDTPAAARQPRHASATWAGNSRFAQQQLTTPSAPVSETQQAQRERGVGVLRRLSLSAGFTRVCFPFRRLNPPCRLHSRLLYLPSQTWAVFGPRPPQCQIPRRQQPYPQLCLTASHLRMRLRIRLRHTRCAVRQRSVCAGPMHGSVHHLLWASGS